MKPATRKKLAQLHLWLGLPPAVVYLVIAVTGILLAVEPEADRLMNRASWTVAEGVERRSLDELTTVARAAAPGYDVKEIRLGTATEPVEYRFEKGPHVRVDPGTAAVLGVRPKGGEGFFGIAEKVHTSLAIGEVGKQIVTISTVVLLLLLASGLVLWAPAQMRLLRNALMPNFSRSGRALHFSLHNTLGFWSAIPLCLMALTGAVMAIKPVGHLMERDYKRTMDREPAALSDPSLPPASLDRIAAAAYSVFPDARQLRLHAPKPAHAHSDDDGEMKMDGPGEKLPYEQRPWRAEAIGANTPHEHARSKAYFDPRTSALIGTNLFADRPLAAQLHGLARPLHDGTLFGLPGRLLMLAGVVMLPVLSVTGVALWWLKRRAQKARELCAVRGLIKPAASLRRPVATA